MATDLTDLIASLSLSLRATAKKALDLSTPQDAVNLPISSSFTFGTGANKANQQWHDLRTLTPSANEELDLSGVLVNAFGVAVTFAKIKAIVIRNTSTDALTVIEVGGAAANAAGLWFKATNDIEKVEGANGWFAKAAPTTGWTVTAGTGDLLKILNTDAVNAATYDIWILGESA